MAAPRVLCLVLASGKGSRLWPMTADRSKSAVPYGASFRLIDFTLSNLVNAGYRQIYVLTQYKSHSLHRHISTTWRMSQFLGAFVTPVPAQQRTGLAWYQGSADAIFQALDLLRNDDPDYIVVMSAGHVYRMDPAQMVAEHIATGAEVTVASTVVPLAQASGLGVMTVGADGRTITTFYERPAQPFRSADDPGVANASMGSYVFTASTLIRALQADAADQRSSHHIATDILPLFVDRETAMRYDFQTNEIPGSTASDHGYWRDIGTLDDYYQGHLDLIAADPPFNLHNLQWPILSISHGLPPAKFGENGTALDSIIGAGTILSGARVTGSVLSEDVRVGAGSEIADSVLLPGVRVGRNVRITNAVLDKNVVVEDEARIGGGQQEPHKGHGVMTAGGVTVIGKGARIEE